MNISQPGFRLQTIDPEMEFYVDEYNRNPDADLAHAFNVAGPIPETPRETLPPTAFRQHIDALADMIEIELGTRPSPAQLQAQQELDEFERELEEDFRQALAEGRVPQHGPIPQERDLRYASHEELLNLIYPTKGPS